MAESRRATPFVRGGNSTGLLVMPSHVSDHIHPTHPGNGLPPAPFPFALRPLAAFFGSMYFIQGVAEPAEGLVAQPVRAMLHSHHVDTATLGWLMGLLGLPWVCKPLFGPVTDFLPLRHSRRKNWLLLTLAISSAGLLAAAWVPGELGYVPLLAILLTCVASAIAFSDVIVDALMIDKGQPLGITGALQSVQWTCYSTAGIATGIVGGYLSQHALYSLAFLICGLCSAAGFLIVLLFVQEPPTQRSPGIAAALRILRDEAVSPLVLTAGGFLLLLNFSPCSSTVLQIYMTNELRFSQQFYGATSSLMSIGFVTAAPLYALYCRRVPFSLLIHASIVTSILSTLAYVIVETPFQAGVVSVFVGVTYMTSMLVQLDLAARLCPPKVAGSLFAILMAVTNLGVSASSALGGELYDRLAKKPNWDAVSAFQFLVILSAACTALCWLLVPKLHRLQETASTARAQSVPEASSKHSSVE